MKPIRIGDVSRITAKPILYVICTNIQLAVGAIHATRANFACCIKVAKPVLNNLKDENWKSLLKVGLGMFNKPKWQGRESNSLSTQEQESQPVKAGRINGTTA